MGDSPRTFRLAHASRGATVDPGSLPLPCAVTRDWAWGSATGAGVRICLIDSGVDTSHAGFTRPITTLTVSDDDVVPDDLGDQAGHGTACAGVIRAVAPDCELTSVRVLGGGLHGRGEALLAALEWAIERRFPLVNLSLSTRRAEHKEALHDLVDRAYFAGVTVVASAHNRPVRSYPWHFPSVISVGSHDLDVADRIEYNPDPPAEFFARGIGVEVPLPGGGTSRLTGNSFATPHITGFCARVLQRHPGFATGQLKHVLAAIADNRT
ncbi:S8 family serine peptidase [Nonomuraea sp. NPDC050556]|uniref:S8 family serine peptidase n=1 Tax=Nonomuraea sp. NPDC050556 TaxID=3364369 RepID=UPI003788A7A4